MKFFQFIVILLFLASCNSNEQNKNISPEGYKYVHHIKNEGPKPVVGDQVTYHYIVFQNDTLLLTSTYLMLEPQSAVLPPKEGLPKPVPPDYDVLFLMSPGDSLTVFQELDTFPPEQLPQGVTNQDNFSYHLKLLSIKSKDIIEKEQAAIKEREHSVADSVKTLIDLYSSGQLKDQLQTTESGLQYIIHKEGSGDKVKDGGFAKVHYSGFLMDGTPFDNSFSKIYPFATRVGRGQVIAGWDEAIPLFNTGTQATLFIPYTLAYGEAGSPPVIPERADLVFYVEVVQVY